MLLYLQTIVSVEKLEWLISHFTDPNMDLLAESLHQNHVLSLWPQRLELQKLLAQQKLKDQDPFKRRQHHSVQPKANVFEN